MKIAAALALGFSLLAAPALAADLTIFGETTLADPTYNRTLSGLPPSGLSMVGTDAHYKVTAFTVATGGAYDFLLTGLNPENWDTFLTLYSGSFDPTAAMTNNLGANDDFPTIGLSGLNANLLAGTSYFAVVTGFDNDDVGSYSLKISGPGAITLGEAGGGGGVPEPSAWALMILGFGATGAALRRRQTAIAA